MCCQICRIMGTGFVVLNKECREKKSPGTSYVAYLQNTDNTEGFACLAQEIKEAVLLHLAGHEYEFRIILR